MVIKKGGTMKTLIHYQDAFLIYSDQQAQSGDILLCYESTVYIKENCSGCIER